MTTLAQILAVMRSEAMFNSDMEIVRTLRNQLTLRLVYESSAEQYRLRAERDKVYPSTTEIDTLRRDFGLTAVGHGIGIEGVTHYRWLAFALTQPPAPTPWTIPEWVEAPTAWNSVLDANGKSVCIQFGPGTRGSAMHMLRLVNSHDKLYAAIRQTISKLEEVGEGQSDYVKVLRDYLEAKV